MRHAVRIGTVIVGALLLTAGCGQQTGPDTPEPVGPRPSPAPSSSAPTPRPAPPPVSTPPPSGWQVGARPLPLRPDGYGVILPTPPELVQRQLPTSDRLPPPAPGPYRSEVSPVPDSVLARSTWEPGCPVEADELRYLTMPFWGFDGRRHTGEMIVHADVSQDVTAVFGELFERRFPIEEMRVVPRSELDLPPTGDGNNTSAFVCRPARGQTRFSAHAYGLAIDVNPFQNPYQRRDVVLPELASAYLDRDWSRPGMIGEGDPTVRAFEEIGWEWGGRWDSPTDIMHFSATGD